MTGFVSKTGRSSYFIVTQCFVHSICNAQSSSQVELSNRCLLWTAPRQLFLSTFCYRFRACGVTLVNEIAQQYVLCAQQATTIVLRNTEIERDSKRQIDILILQSHSNMIFTVQRKVCMRDHLLLFCLFLFLLV